MLCVVQILDGQGRWKWVRPQDGTITINDAVGHQAKVLTAIPVGGYGVVRLTIGGHTMTYNATAGMPIEPGLDVQVVGVVSPTALRVNAVWHPTA